PQRLDRRQRRIESVLADTVIRNINALAVEKHLVCASLARQLGLFVRAYCRDDIAAQVLDDLREKQSHSAGTRVDERGLARLDLMRTRRQVLRRQSLQRHRRSHLGGYTFRHAQEEVRVHDNLRRIRPRALMPSDTVTDLPALNALAHLGDRPRALNSDDMRIL